MSVRKLITLRRPDTCVECSEALAAGTKAYWDAGAGTVTCVDCITNVASQPPMAAVAAEPSVAGASARRENERRRHNRHDRYEQRFGRRLGGVAAKLVPPPQSEQAWAVGARGEELNSARLDKRLADSPVQLLHDRRLRGRRANIDHIAIGPGGVTVIDSKNYAGKVRVVSSGGLLGPRIQELYIGRRRRTALVEGVERQVEAVSLLLLEAGMPHVAVTGALCMTRAEELPLFRSQKVRDVTIDGPRKIAMLSERAGPLTPETIETIARVLERALPAA